jgi:hypothetical protein
MGRHSAPSRRRRPWPLAVVAAAVVTFTAGPVLAYWSGAGLGTGSAAAGTLTAPASASATSTPGNPDVSVTWTAATVPSGATLDGYYVTRLGGGPAVGACGSDLDNLLPDAPRSCTDADVPVGTYTYTVTAVLSGWTGTSPTSSPVTVTTDANAPTMTLTGTDLVNSYLGPNGTNYRLYFRSTQTGSFRLAATVTDSGSGPASVTFPTVTAGNWTHPGQTVTSGTGSPPSVTFTSSAYSWVPTGATPATTTITGRDELGNTVTRTVTFRVDNTPPTGGALVVNGSTANTAGTATSTSTTGSWSITTLRQYTETQSATRSGLASSTLVRETAPYAGGACGTTWSDAVTITGSAPVTQTGADGTCYRYRLTGVDNVGNSVSRTTTVRVDTSVPTGGALTANGTAATAGGSTSSSTTGSWTLARTDWTDAQSGMTSSTLVRTQAALTNGVCGTFGTATTITGAPAQTGTARTCYRYVLTGTNTFGVTSSVTTTVVVGPYVSAFALLNGGGIAGRATQGDQMVVTFSDPVAPSTLCSSWSGSGDQVLDADNQVTVRVTSAAGSDTLTVTATGCTFNVGSVSLGSTAYTTANATFGGAGAARSTVTWTAATRTLTVTLGATTSTSLATVASSTAIYTPSTSVQSASGVALGGTFSTGAVQQF